MVDEGVAMLQSIGNHKPFGFVYGIVSGGLVKDGLGDFNGGRFTLDHHDAFAVGVVDDDVCSFLEFVQC